MRFSPMITSLLVATTLYAADRKEVENPEYASWAKAKIGTVIVTKDVSGGDEAKIEITATLKLVEINKDNITLECTTKVATINYIGGLATPPKQLGEESKPRTMNIARMIKETPKDKYNIQIGNVRDEKIKIADKQYDVSVSTKKVSYDEGKTYSFITVYTNPNIPGTVAKRVTKREDPQKSETIFEIISLTTPP